MSATSKVETLIDALRTRILAGEFGESKLPSFRTLGKEYKTTQETMNKSMQALQAEGLLVSAGTKGVFVNKPRMRVPAMVANFYQHIQQYDFEAMEELIIKPEVISPATNIAKKMLLGKDEQVLRRMRLQGSTQMPFRLADSYYPMSLITDEMLEQVFNDQHFNIAETIQKKFNKTIKHTHEEVIARLPITFEQEHLKIVRTNPVIDMTVVTFTGNKKKVVMYNHVVFNANLFLFSYDYDIDQWE
ncbi:MAG TPA: GntR family transcriptional regulator [Methylomirabilota bacterium]|nr:GntR family transcriptional regulator [Methylomirabilota bacterium]